MKISFAGLGKMGAPIAMNLAKGGDELTVFDINESNLAKFSGLKNVKTTARPALSFSVSLTAIS